MVLEGFAGATLAFPFVFLKSSFLHLPQSLENQWFWKGCLALPLFSQYDFNDPIFRNFKIHCFQITFLAFTIWTLPEILYYPPL